MVKPAFGVVRSPEMAKEDRSKQVTAFHECVRKNAEGKISTYLIFISN